MVVELLLDELLVLVDFFLSSSSSSSLLVFAGVDGARFVDDPLLRVSVRVLVTERFFVVCVFGWLDRVLLAGVR